MKITKQYLRKLIKEETDKTLKEGTSVSGVAATTPTTATTIDGWEEVGTAEATRKPIQLLRFTKATRKGSMILVDPNDTNDRGGMRFYDERGVGGGYVYAEGWFEGANSRDPNPPVVQITK